jgi:nucleotide-binding universal stress UspA family protein
MAVMKMLVCTDGSEKSVKAVKKAAFIGEQLKEVSVTLIHVYYLDTAIISPHADGYVTGEILQRIDGEKKEEGKKILAEAAKIFEEKNIKVNTLLTKGHPATTIIEAAAQGKYDLVVIGSRGLGGLKKLLLGSVSNAVAQEVVSTVMIVK